VPGWNLRKVKALESRRRFPAINQLFMN